MKTQTMKHTDLYETPSDKFLPGPELDEAWEALKANPNGDTTNNMRLALLAGYDRARLHKQWNNQ